MVERVRETVERETRPEIPETVNADRRRKKENSGTACAACLADSVGLCSIHERDITNVSLNEQGSFRGNVAAEAAKGGSQKTSLNLGSQKRLKWQLLERRNNSLT